MKAGDEITIRLRVEEPKIGGCIECFYYKSGDGCLLEEYASTNSDSPCKGEDIIFKQIKETPEKSR